MHVQSWIPQWISFSNQNNFDRIYSKGQKNNNNWSKVGEH